MFSIIVPAYHIDESCHALTNACLESIRRHTIAKHDIILVDSYPTARLTYAQAVNKGLRQASGKFIVILNNDVEVCDGWLESMVECFTLKDCGIATLLGREHGHLKCEGVIEDFYGPCWMLSRKSFDTIGYLDEQFVNSFEDADYWVRAYLAGYKIYRNCGCVVNHKERATCSKISTDASDSINNRELFNSKYGELDLPIYKRLRG